MPIIGNPLNSVAFLTDSFNGNGSTTAFTMSVAPATSSSILVNITGVTQAPSTYSVVGTTLTFSTAPPSGTANISVRYLGIPASGVTTTAYRTLTEFTATASQTTFTPPSYTVGFIAVYQNGVRLGSTDYTATNGTTVVLAVGALVGDLISTESFYVSSVLNAIPATAGAVNSSYIASGAVTLTTQVTGTLPVANGGSGVTTSTGSGTNVLGTSPTLVTPLLGTPTSGILTNCTGISLAKAWCYFTVSAGVVTLQNSFNVSSVTRNAAGDFTVNLTNASSNARLCGSVCCSVNTAGTALMFGNLIVTTASTYRFYTLGSFLYSGAADPTDCNVTIFGS